MACASGTSWVCLVNLVYPVSLVQPNKQDKPNKPIKRDRPDRPAEVCDIKGWGATARTEAQWCHLLEASEISGILNAPNQLEYRALL